MRWRDRLILMTALGGSAALFVALLWGAYWAMAR